MGKKKQISSTIRFPFYDSSNAIIYKNVPIWGLSCNHRQDRRNRMNQEWKSRNLSIEWFLVDKHPTDPKVGCWESHRAMWRRAREQSIEWLCIVEDDAQWIGSHTSFPVIPANARMAYLGGLVHFTWEDAIQESLLWNHGTLRERPSEWIRAITWTTHAYLIRLTDLPELLNQFLEKPARNGCEIDRFFVEDIHPIEPCYVIRNLRLVQRSDFSDIEGRIVDYSPMSQTAWGMSKPDMTRGSEGELRVSLPPMEESKLPAVSIITPTWNRSHLWGWCMRNIFTQWYPHTKIEWIILEEDWSHNPNSSYCRPTIRDDLPPDGDIIVRYIPVKPQDDGRPQTIAWKRNKGCELAKNPIIVFFDDDDYYPPTSLVSRVKMLLHYRNKSIVGTSIVACYNVTEPKSGFLTDGRLAISEASLAFWKRAWLEQAFDPTEERGEYRGFLNQRWNMVIDMPSVFILYALKWKHHQERLKKETTVGRTMAGAQWRDSNRNEPVDFRQWWDPETREWLERFKEIDETQ